MENQTNSTNIGNSTVSTNTENNTKLMETIMNNVSKCEHLLKLYQIKHAEFEKFYLVITYLFDIFHKMNDGISFDLERYLSNFPDLNIDKLINKQNTLMEQIRELHNNFNQQSNEHFSSNSSSTETTSNVSEDTNALSKDTSKSTPLQGVKKKIAEAQQKVATLQKNIQRLPK